MLKNVSRLSQHLAEIEPLLRATATVEIDASAPTQRVVEQLESLAAEEAID